MSTKYDPNTRENKRIKNIIEAFSSEIKNSKKFEILFSEKAGYVWVYLEDDDFQFFDSHKITNAGNLLRNMIDYVAETILAEKIRNKTYEHNDFTVFMTYLYLIFSEMKEDRDFCEGYLEAMNYLGQLEKEIYLRFRESSDDE